MLYKRFVKINLANNYELDGKHLSYQALLTIIPPTNLQINISLPSKITHCTLVAYDLMLLETDTVII